MRGNGAGRRPPARWAEGLPGKEDITDNGPLTIVHRDRQRRRARLGREEKTGCHGPHELQRACPRRRLPRRSQGGVGGPRARCESLRSFEK